MPETRRYEDDLITVEFSDEESKRLAAVLARPRFKAVKANQKTPSWERFVFDVEGGDCAS
jgi:hypothetical protein